MSERRAQHLREDIADLGPMRLREVQEAQQRIVALIRGMAARGELTIRRGGGDELIC